MDAFLDYLGLYRSDVAKDGSCLFRAVSEQLFYTQVHHVKLRENCVEYIRRNHSSFADLISEDFEEYLDRIKNEKEWAGGVEMQALSVIYRVKFLVYYEVNKPPLTVNPDVSPRQTITLSCTNGNCYDCVYEKNELSVLAFCQSLVYEVLYKSVFDLGSDVDIAVEKMLHDKAYSKQRRNNLLSHLFRESCRIENAASDESNLPEDDQTCDVIETTDSSSLLNPRLEIRKALAQGVPPFPYKVAKTLDAGIYRNVEFDLWNEKRKEDQKQEQFITPKLEPGVKCKVYINKEKFNGYVQEIFSDNENVSVYIEEFCKRCVVSSSVLEIVSIPAYKALTWQGGKTYKVYSDLQTGTDTEKKYKRYFNKFCQDHSPTNHPVNTNMKPNTIQRSNSMPAGAVHRASIPRCNSLYCSPQLPPRKSNNRKSKIHSDKELNQQPVHVSPGIPVIWNGISSNIATSPIPIPGKVSPDCFQNQPPSPEMLNEFHDPRWVEESPVKTFSPPHAYLAGFPEETFATTSVPLPIPNLPQGEHSPVPVALYPYPVYTLPGMYVLCREGSTVPVNIGAWPPQDGNGEVPSGIPSMYFNTPPPTMSPPMTSWIPATLANYGSTWPPGMTTTVAFTPPPLDVNHSYQPIMSPPWSPAQYIAPPIPAPIAYQVQQPPIISAPPENNQN